MLKDLPSIILCLLVQISYGTVTIRVQNSGGILYENTSTEDFLLLDLNYSVTGLLEITVTFSSDTCEKSSVIKYLGKMQCISCV